MSGVLSFAPGDPFQFTVYSRLISSPEKVWSNSYGVYAISGGVQGDLAGCAQSLALFHQACSLSIAQVWKVEVRTGYADSDPYNPGKFFTIVFNMTGTRNGASGDALAVDIALAVAKAVASGKLGGLSLRAMLSEGDVYAYAGNFVLQNAASISAVIASAVANSLLGRYFAGGADTVLRISLLSYTTGIVRQVLGVAVTGVQINKRNHRYYDRTPKGVVVAGPLLPDVTDVVNADWQSIEGLYNGSQWEAPAADTTFDQP